MNVTLPSMNVSRYLPKLAIGFALLCVSSPLYPEYRMFFIGNSFINASGSAETIPGIVEALAEAGGHTVPETLMQYISGGSFADQLDGTPGLPTNKSTPTLLDTDATAPWTHVVMTNVSSQPTRAGDVQAHMEDGMELYELIKASNPSAKVVMNQSWARSTAHGWMDGDPFETPFEMAKELWVNYRALADAINAQHPDFHPAVVAPVGNAWGNAGGYVAPADPDYFDLHGPDEYHGNDRGHYLTGCVTYSMLYGVSPEGLHTHSAIQNLNLSISDAQALRLEAAAWRTVLAAGVASERILVDFGPDTAPTTTDTAREEAWNHLNPTLGGASGSVLSNLVAAGGRTTPVLLEVMSPFDASNSGGTEESTRYPASATSDSLTGGSGTAPSIQFSGLDPDAAYRLTFYASWLDVDDPPADPVQTRYTVKGAAERFVVLDVLNNQDAAAETEALFPDDDGTLLITLSADSGPGDTYLGSIELTTLPERRLSILNQPQSQSVEQNTSVTFTLGVNVGYALDIQWYQDGAPIPGANDLTYSLKLTDPGMDGAEFHAVISNDVVTLTSDTATVYLTEDVTPPEATGVGLNGTDVLELTFSEALEQTSATDPVNYRVANRGRLLTPASVNLSGDGRTVTLTLDSGLEEHYVVSVASEVADVAGNPIPAQTFLKGAAPRTPTDSILIDFGVVDDADHIIDGERWNAIDSSATLDSGAVSGVGGVDNLLTLDGSLSGIAVEVISPFRRVSTTGTENSTEFPSQVSHDTLFGHTGNWDGLGPVVPEFKLSGFHSSEVCSLVFYASRTNVSDIRETLYVVTGSEEQSVALNASNNINDTAVLDHVIPDASGEITILLQKGPNNSRSEGYVYLGVLEISIYDGDPEPSLYPPVILGDGTVIDWVGDGVLSYTDELNNGSWIPYETPPASPFIDRSDIPTSRFYRLEFSENL